MQLKLPTRKGAGSTGSPALPELAQANDVPKLPELVGLDISSGSLAAVRMGNGKIQNASVADVDPSLISEGEVANIDGLADVLAEFFKANGLPKKVRLGVAGQRAVIRTIELPVINDPKQLDAAVRFQAQENIPMPLAEAILDYQVVEHIITDDTQKLKVVLVAASRVLVEGLMESCGKAGLKPQGIDLDAFALIRVLYPGHASEHETIAYVNYGDLVNVTLAAGKVCTFTRATPKGFEDTLSHIATRARLTREHARMWCNHVGLVDPPEAIDGDPDIIYATRDELEVAVNDLGTDIRAAIDFYTAQEGTNPVSRVMLAGPGGTIPGIAETLSARVGLPVAVPPPLGAIDADSVDSVGIDHHRLTLAAGLAMNEVIAA